jgi:hypothetical protein
MKALEDALEILLGDAYAFIFHFQQNMLVVGRLQSHGHVM